MRTSEAIIKRIFALCDEHCITINKLANISGVTQSTLHSIVSSDNNSPKVTTIKKICDGLGITLTDFFNDELFYDLEQEIR